MFWELENVDVEKPKNKEAIFCESRDIALKRLNALWTRLIRDPQYLKLYRDFIHEYDQLGHMKEVVAEHDNSEVAYYMPHHGVLRPEKSTTKLRVVFNATNLTIIERDEEKNFPLAAPVLRELLYGRRSLRRCVFNGSQGLENQLSGILKKGGMELHKWGSSHPELASNILGDYEFENPIETKTLESRLFDPLGLLGPVVARAKIFMQSLWSLKIDWIDELPSERAKEWHRFLEDFNSVRSICIGRCIVHPQATRVELHGFADVSEKCYGAVIYCRSQSPDGATTVKLVTSKSRVAPVKSVTMPRLELCAAVLLAKLMKRVETALQMKTPPCTCGVIRLLS
ncbi:uncharacterized protein TNCV_413221 [Trichonephila clavipes]|nr:uncharacterized protein TNCV_413221 [Trichonephila clavipes]